jgi:16S rRNA (cytosine967-C5)-methyltransferase
VSGPGAASGRLAALQLLEQVLDGGKNLSEVAAGPDLPDPRDRSFARFLAFGVLRWLPALDWLAAQLLRRPLKRRDRDLRRLILIGLFQLWQDGTAEHAAVNECAEGARELGKPWAVALVNAVLRRFQREREALLDRLASRDERFAHPDWLLHVLRQDWPDCWPEIVAANNQAGGLWLRTRRGVDHTALADRLAGAGFDTAPHLHAPDALRVEPATTVDALPGFAEGLLSVQDPAAQLAAGLLEMAPGQRVLDACAAPGGKTCHILEVEPNVELTALDHRPDRLERVTENLRRLGFEKHPRLRLAAGDAAEPAGWWDGAPFHRILLDAPCTATGVIRRHPEIKWLRNRGQLLKAIELQERLLQRLWPLLDAGGILLYATCSVLKDENCRQIEQFVGHRSDADLMAIDADWGHPLEYGRQILPGEQDMDGFFYARLRKV